MNEADRIGVEGIAAQLGLESFRCPSCGFGVGLALHRVGDAFARAADCPTCLGGRRVWRHPAAGGMLTWAQVLKMPVEQVQGGLAPPLASPAERARRA